jgi:hypothetical protein
MKKLSRRIAVGLLAFVVGFAITVIARKYFFYLTWQGDIELCNNTEIKNPLCNYSTDLSEIPTVRLSDLVNNPSWYNGKIVRVHSRFYAELEDPFKSYLYEADGSIGKEQLGTIVPWSDDVYRKLCNFIDLNAPESNKADVVVIIRFDDVTDNPHRKETDERFDVAILHTEQMSVISPDEKSNPPRKHKEGHCWVSSTVSF